MRLIFHFFSLLYAGSLFSQSLPSQWHYADEGRILRAGDALSTGLYDESSVKEIRLYFSSPTYWTQLTQNYNAKVDMLAKLTYDGVTYDSIGVRFKGQTSYKMNTSPKKSFNITLDFVRPDQHIDGYQTLNLNNSWTDPSFMREVLYYRLIRQHTPAAQANFVRLFINDQDWGIYQNVQQLNKDFLKEWYKSNDGINMRADIPDGASSGTPFPGGGGMWGDGTAGFNYLGIDSASYKKYYTLKSSGVEQPWQKLIDAARILNNTSLATLETEAPKMFDIDKILWHLASEIVFGDDDSYVYKGKMDYYLYFDEVTQRWATYDYDANSTFLPEHVTWSPFYNATKVNYPLLNKLLAVPSFKQRYLAHVRTLVNDLLDESKTTALIDGYDKLIRDMVFADTKKPSTNTAYTSNLTVLKTYIKNRKANLLANAEVAAKAPSVANLRYLAEGVPFGTITEGNAVTITCEASFAAGVKTVNLYYGTGFSSIFTALPMNDTGTNGDSQAGDGVYSIALPSLPATTFVKYYIEAIGNDAAATRTYLPAGTEHECMVLQIGAKTSSAKTVVINEFMAANTGIIKDEAGETEDWIELHNLTNDFIDLAGYSISDSKDNLTKYTFPQGVTIGPKGYLIIWADEDGTQGINHANFKLSQSGESIFLLDPAKVIIDSVSFGQQTVNKSSARKPNGTGSFSIGDHTFNANNDGTSANQDYLLPAVSIVPNPAGQYFTLQGLQQQAPVTILDENGKEMMKTVATPQEQINISHLPDGLYFVLLPYCTKPLIVVH